MEQHEHSDENIKGYDQFEETGVSGTWGEFELYPVSSRIPANGFIEGNWCYQTWFLGLQPVSIVVHRWELVQTG